MSRYRAQIKEVINRNMLVSLALDKGYNAFLPVYDSGIDLILYNERDDETKLVQLKGRWIIDKKYVGRNIWIAFQDRGRWYLAPHDKMIEHADRYGYTETSSWIKGGAYSTPGLSKVQIGDLAVYAFDPLEKVAAAAATD